MNEFDENDAVWKVLGQAKPTKASPYFVRKVLREVRTADSAPSHLATLIRWLFPIGAAAALALSLATWQEPKDEEFIAYFDSAADLQSLVAFEDAAIWIDVN